MRILFLARSTLYSGFGGDTVQITSTAKFLRQLGVTVDIKLSNQPIDYKEYDLLHVFNVGRPADLLRHIGRSKLPYVVSTIFLDHDEFQRHNGGMRSLLSRYISADRFEYIKTIARRVRNGEAIQSPSYLYYGHRESVRRLAKGAAFLAPNSESEYRRFSARYSVSAPYRVVYNGIDKELFSVSETVKQDPGLVVCVARIEGNKNQANLIRAVNGTKYRLRVVGKPAPNHIGYYDYCKKIAGDNVTFTEFLPQGQLADEYGGAKVHVLPSWNETCGLSSLEAAYCGCNLVITDKGDTKEYFEDNAWYCDPASPESIYDAITRAAQAPASPALKNKIDEIYNWKKAAETTLAVYEEVLSRLARNNQPKRSLVKPGL